MPMPGSEAARKDPRTMHHYTEPAVMEPRRIIISTPSGPNYLDFIQSSEQAEPTRIHFEDVQKDFQEARSTFRREILGHWVDVPYDSSGVLMTQSIAAVKARTEKRKAHPPKTETFFQSLVDAGVVKL